MESDLEERVKKIKKILTEAADILSIGAIEMEGPKTIYDKLRKLDWDKVSLKMFGQMTSEASDGKAKDIMLGIIGDIYHEYSKAEAIKEISETHKGLLIYECHCVESMFAGVIKADDNGELKDADSKPSLSILFNCTEEKRRMLIAFKSIKDYASFTADLVKQLTKAKEHGLIDDEYNPIM